MNMKQLSDKDQEEIQAKFNELKDKLNLLKKIAIDNQFLDSDDIVEMVDKLNNVTADKKQEIKSIPATSAKMVENKSSEAAPKCLSPQPEKRPLLFHPNSSATQFSIFLVSLEKFTPRPIIFLSFSQYAWWYFLSLICSSATSALLSSLNSRM